MSTENQAVGVSKGALWAGRIMSALPILLMLATGTMGIVKPETAAEGMKEFGYPESVALYIGLAEVGSIILYAIPQTSVLGAIIVTGYLGGATATHVRVEDPMFVIAVIVGVLVWGGLYLRDPRIRALIPLRRPAK